MRQSKLAQLGLGVRLAVALLMGTLVLGYVVSGLHLRNHHQNRDERPGLTFDDLVGAYHGITSPSPMLRALQDGHPAEVQGAAQVPDADRAALVAWLTGPRVNEDYDNLDLGDAAPEVLIQSNCLSCHSRQAVSASATNASKLALEFWDDIKAVAFSRNVSPTEPKIIAASVHAHAPSMALVLTVLVVMAAVTRWPRALVGLVALISAAGLLADISGQLTAQHSASLVWLIVVGGFAAAAGTAALAVLVALDALLPGPAVNRGG